VPPAGVAVDLLSLMDGPSPTVGAPQGMGAHPMGSPLGVVCGAPVQTAGTGLATPGMGGMSAMTAVEVPPGAATVASDAMLGVMCTVATPAEKTEIRLFLKPAAHVSLRNVVLQVEPPPTLKMDLSAPPPGEARGGRVLLPALHGGSSGCVSASFIALSPLTGAEMVLLGQVSYLDASATAPRVLSFKLPLVASQLLRPYKVTTAQFGQMWPAHAAEKKTVTYASVSGDPASFMALLQRQLQLSAVDTIGMECIACGKLVGSDHSLLVHGKLGLMAGRALELTVRSRDPRFTDAMQRQLIEHLSK